MARPYVFPDVDDCSPNSPSMIVKSATILGLYKDRTGEQMANVTEKVRTWFCDEAKKENWDEAVFSGNQCILSVKLEKRNNPG